MKVELLSITPNAEELIEKATRTCYDSTPNPETRVSFLKGVMSRGHTSVIEHASATFKIEGVSRALTHQLVRHRIASYSQVSQRYVKFLDFNYVTPPSIASNQEAEIIYRDTINRIKSSYERLIYLGIKAEDARYLLPNGCDTTITMTMNFRSLINFFNLRLDKHAQWEIRNLAKEMFKLVFEHAPTIFENLILLAGETE